MMNDIIFLTDTNLDHIAAKKNVYHKTCIKKDRKSRFQRRIDLIKWYLKYGTVNKYYNAFRFKIEELEDDYDIVIVDDMISSGEKVVDIARDLKRRKAKRIRICTRANPLGKQSEDSATGACV